MCGISKFSEGLQNHKLASVAPSAQTTIPLRLRTALSCHQPRCRPLWCLACLLPRPLVHAHARATPAERSGRLTICRRLLAEHSAWHPRVQPKSSEPASHAAPPPITKSNNFPIHQQEHVSHSFSFLSEKMCIMIRNGSITYLPPYFCGWTYPMEQRFVMKLQQMCLPIFLSAEKDVRQVSRRSLKQYQTSTFDKAQQFCTSQNIIAHLRLTFT